LATKQLISIGIKHTKNVKPISLPKYIKRYILKGGYLGVPPGKQSAMKMVSDPKPNRKMLYSKATALVTKTETTNNLRFMIDIATKSKTADAKMDANAAVLPVG